jgi:hypothetical protein
MVLLKINYYHSVFLAVSSREAICSIIHFGRCVSSLPTNFFFCKKNVVCLPIVLCPYVKLKGNLFGVNLKINNVEFRVQIVVPYTTFPRNAVPKKFKIYWVRSYSRISTRPIVWVPGYASFTVQYLLTDSCWPSLGLRFGCILWYL